MANMNHFQRVFPLIPEQMAFLGQDKPTSRNRHYQRSRPPPSADQHDIGLQSAPRTTGRRGLVPSINFQGTFTATVVASLKRHYPERFATSSF
jgi:hypothetical protein